MHIVHPDTTFVLHINAFTHKACSGYRCNVWDGRVLAQKPMLSGADALAYLARHPDTTVDVLHI